MIFKTLAQTSCAALMLCASPALAGAPNGDVGPAVATGLAIPFPEIDRAEIAATPEPRLAVPGRGRMVLVDAADARLYMIEDGEVRDSMKVIVGKPTSETPELRSTLYYATLNPYWNVPVDLGRTLIAPNVLEQGMSYLRDRGYEVVTHFGKGAELIDPESIDWAAVAAGEVKVHVRQRPGPANSMGEIKFGIPGASGIYLHDTPRKALFEEADRSLSSGCIRLEDAERFAEWLLRDEVDLERSRPEQHVALPAGVPIVVAYLPGTQALASLR